MTFNFAFTYLVKRFFCRIAGFLRHWYVDGTKKYLTFVIDKFEELDRFFAWKITFFHLFSPLYKDYSFLGYVLGFILRLSRLIVALIIYLVLSIVAFLLYVVWALFPPSLLYNIVSPFL